MRKSEQKEQKKQALSFERPAPGGGGTVDHDREPPPGPGYLISITEDTGIDGTTEA